MRGRPRRSVWELYAEESIDRAVEGDPTIRAEAIRLRRLLENLFRNAVEHGSTDDDAVTATLGSLPGGFYVEDDGPGLPEDHDVFEAGCSTETDGTGLGLAIVERVAAEHGWSVDATDGSDGGARFEFRR